MSKRNRFSNAEIRSIQDFISNIDADIQVFRGHCFEVDIEEEKIYLGNKRFDRVSALFMDYWQQECKNFNINWCILSILHEIGHIMTTTEELEDNRFQLDNIYSFMYQEQIINEKEYFNSYFSIPAEREATLWGIDYYKNNINICNKLAAALGLR